MPVRKFRSVEEIPPAPPGVPGDPRNLERAFSLIELCYHLNPWRFPPGVYKHRTIENLNRQRDAWEGDRARAAWERRRG